MIIIRNIPQVSGEYEAVYPPAYSDTYVKSTSNTLGMSAYLTMDPSKSLVGDAYGNCWMSNNGNPSNQRFHVDLGIPRIIRKIDYCNYHNAGYNTSRCVQSFALQGSNSASAFNALTYATDTGWTAIAKSPASMVRHTETSNGVIWNTITITDPSVAYRYYALKCASNYGDTGYMGIRRLVFFQ